MYKKLITIITFCFLITILIDPSSVAFARDETVDDWFNTEQEETDEQTIPAQDTFETEQDEGLTFPFFRMILAFGFVVLLIYGLAKFLNKRTRSFAGTRSLESLGGISVGQNRSIQIVKVGDRLLVVGVSNTIQLLKEIDDESEVERLLQEREQALEQQDFLQKSKEWLQKKQLSKQESFTTVLDKQMKKIVKDRQNVYLNARKKESRDE